MMHVVYQTKMRGEKDYCRPAYIDIGADNVTDAINNFHRLIYKCFGDDIRARIVAIVPPKSGAYLFGYDSVAREMVAKIV